MIAMFQTKGLEEPSLNLTDPREIAEFEDAKKKVAFAKSWSPIAIVVLACGAIVCAWFGAMA